jgi:hypothetical protein
VAPITETSDAAGSITNEPIAFVSILEEASSDGVNMMQGPPIVLVSDLLASFGHSRVNG